jgi:hypothetical protein
MKEFNAERNNDITYFFEKALIEKYIDINRAARSTIKYLREFEEMPTLYLDDIVEITEIFSEYGRKDLAKKIMVRLCVESINEIFPDVKVKEGDMAEILGVKALIVKN